MDDKPERSCRLQFIYNISLGCGECRHPLEPTEPVNRVFRKFQMQKDLCNAERVSDPVPVATKCGHIFHRGCIKKIISNMASGKIPCPTCTKPVILSHLHVVKFFYPPKKDSLLKRIRIINEENNSLLQELDEVRNLRTKKQFEEQLLSAKIGEIKKELKQLDASIARSTMLYEDFKHQGVNPQGLGNLIQKTKTNILEISLENSDLLQRLEVLMDTIQNGDSNKEKRKQLAKLKLQHQGRTPVKETRLELNSVADYYAKKLADLKHPQQNFDLMKPIHSSSSILPICSAEDELAGSKKHRG